MKGTMVKCLQCNTVSVYMISHDDTARCPVCNGYAIPHGECNIVEEEMEQTSLYGPDGLIETVCVPIKRQQTRTIPFANRHKPRQ